MHCGHGDLGCANLEGVWAEHTHSAQNEVSFPVTTLKTTGGTQGLGEDGESILECGFTTFTAS